MLFRRHAWPFLFAVVSFVLMANVSDSFAASSRRPSPPPRPKFQLLQPSAGAVFQGPLNIPITVQIPPQRGLNRKYVAFYANRTRLALQSALQPAIVWPNVPPGTYLIKAILLSSPRARSGTATRTITIRVIPTPPSNPNNPGNPGTPSGPGGPPIGPVSGHPRMWIRADDLPKLRSWANASNPLFELTEHLADQMLEKYESGKVPGTCVDANNDNNPDNEWDYGLNVFWGPPVEQYAHMFAFMSLIEPNPARQAKFQTYAHDLVMTVINQAKLGVYHEKEECLDLGLAKDSCACRTKRRYRDMLPANSQYVSHYLLGDKGFVFDGLPLAIDWVYPTFSADEKQSIRSVFLIWIKDFLDAEFFYAPRPIGLINNSLLLHLDDPYLSELRFGANNHYLSYLRGVGLMSLALDTADDTGPKDALGNGVTDYLANAIQSWLLITDFERRYDTPGGLSPEGSMYSDLGLKFEMQFRLALATSGLADPAKWGEQVDFYNHPFWDKVVPAHLHQLPPTPVTLESWQGPVFLQAFYGDGQTAYQTDITGFLGSVGLYDQLSGNTQRAQDIRWFLKNVGPGGNSQWLTRVRSSLPNTAIRDAIISYLLFDPTLPEAGDPRPAIGNDFFDPGIGRVLSRTGSDPSSRFFSYKLSWNRIDHNHDDGNMFEFWRKGQWLTKKWVGYGPADMRSDFNNTLAVKNFCGPTGEYPSSGYNYEEWKAGSQFALGSGTLAAVQAHNPGDWQHTPMDPRVLALSLTPGAKFAAVTGDSTILYSHWDKYNPPLNCEDVQHVSRTAVWLKPDHVIVYDRAKTGHPNMKRFWLNLPSQPSISPVSGGTRAVMTTPDNTQQLSVTTILPAPGSVTVSSTADRPISYGHDETATGENMAYRLVAEANGNPAETRFLNVLQGVDSGVPLDSVTLVQSQSGNLFQGACVHGVAVMFRSDLQQGFSSTTYSAPGCNAHIVTGLTPNAGYTVTANGGTVTVTNGGATIADSGGVLAIGALP